MYPNHHLCGSFISGRTVLSRKRGVQRESKVFFLYLRVGVFPHPPRGYAGSRKRGFNRFFSTNVTIFQRIVMTFAVPAPRAVPSLGEPRALSGLQLIKHRAGIKCIAGPNWSSSGHHSECLDAGKASSPRYLLGQKSSSLECFLSCWLPSFHPCFHPWKWTDAPRRKAGLNAKAFLIDRNAIFFTVDPDLWNIRFPTF